MNITIGQYYPIKSVIHSLDPRAKLISTIIYIIALFFVHNFIGYIFAALCLGLVIYLSKVPIKYMLKGLRAIFFILIFTVSLNILFTPGETVIFHFWIFTVTLEGLIFAAQMCIRLVLLVIGSSVLTLTTSPIELTDAFEYLMLPLKRFGFPAHDVAMMMSIALRFIPTLVEEVNVIMKAQKARGADFDTGGLFKKAKSLVPLLVPLFVSSFKRADDLALAMDARCYRGDVNRTKMKQLIYTRTDAMFLISSLAFVAIILLTGLL